MLLFSKLNKYMVSRNELVNFLNIYFSVEKYGPDPAMSRFVPLVYDNFNWREYFTEYFSTLFNGLMISGDEYVSHVFGSVFPTEEVLNQFINEAEFGDLLFLHHPIDMECGDPQGKSGRFILPIKKEFLNRIKNKKLSIYSCHHPLDCHYEISTGMAIAKEIGLKNIIPCIKQTGGFVGLIGEIDDISSDKLIEKLKTIFCIPYLDFGGKVNNSIKKVVIVPGGGDKIDFFKEAETSGVDAYISGEIHSHIDNEKGKAKMEEALEYMKDSKMSFFGVSHASSEFLVIKKMVLPFLAKKFELPVKEIPLSNWWH